MQKVDKIIENIFELKNKVEQLSMEYKVYGIHYTLNIFAPNFFANTFCKKLNEEEIQYLFENLYKTIPNKNLKCILNKEYRTQILKCNKSLEESNFNFPELKLQETIVDHLIETNKREIINLVKDDDINECCSDYLLEYYNKAFKRLGPINKCELILNLSLNCPNSELRNKLIEDLCNLSYKSLDKLKYDNKHVFEKMYQFLNKKDKDKLTKVTTYLVL